MRRVLGLVAAVTLAAACTDASGGQSDANAVGAFDARVKAYAALHKRLESTLPPRAKEAAPALIHTHQRALQGLIKEHRKTARRGDIFGADGERVIRRLVAQVLRGPDGAKLKAVIMDENPVGVKLGVNDRYPDEIPLSTMPTQLLAVLPKLPEELEYRFIGDRLILLDVHAHTVVDYIERALP